MALSVGVMVDKWRVEILTLLMLRISITSHLKKQLQTPLNQKSNILITAL